jgi:hypothetical protein
MASTAAFRDDVQLQRTYDDRRTAGWPVFNARHQAVIEALDAVTLNEDPCAKYALRQALVDMSSCCEHIAEKLPRPVRPY